MSGLTLSHQVLIREHHLDSYGHVNNAAYLTLYEEARWEIITSRGYGYHEIHAKRLGPVILEVTLTFRKELRLRDSITITCQTTRVEGRVGHLYQQMLNEAGDVCSTADFTWGLFDLEARKLVKPTPQWLAAVGWTEPD